MRIPGKLMLSSAMILAASSLAWSEGSLRHKLLDSKMPSSVYSVDEHTTFFRANDGEDVEKTLSDICQGFSGEFAANEGAFSCKGVFEASRVAGQEQSFVLKTETPQPLAYISPSVPSIEEVAAPPLGKIDGEHASVDMYQYMYALCKKENGTPSVVISKRLGKVARYTEVGAEEAFSYLLSPENGKDPWFFACEGETRFMVEKDYQYNSDGPASFYFHPRRGLEWVDYVKADNGKLASLSGR